MALTNEAAGARRRPIQLNHTKREARRLADWTGLSLSESQEVTANAYGATSWQALIKDPTFVADEDLHYLASYDRPSVEARYDALGELLTRRLNVSPVQAQMVAAYWQPTALQANFTLAQRCHGTVHSNEWEVLHVIHGVAGSDSSVAFALAEWELGEPGIPPKRALIAVPTDRMARYVAVGEALQLVPGKQVGPGLAGPIATLEESWYGGSLTEVAAAISRELKRPSAVQLEVGGLDRKTPNEGVRLRAKWLREPPADRELFAQFAARHPWRIEDCPGVRKSHARTFWAVRTPGFVLNAMIYEGEVFFSAMVGNETHSQVQGGVGSLRLMNGEPRFRNEPPYKAGFYLVKYGNQRRSHYPLPQLDEHMARELRLRAGLDDSGFGPSDVFASEAGLGLAKWAAAFPRRAARHLVTHSYLGDVRASVLKRMEFELAREGALD